MVQNLEAAFEPEQNSSFFSIRQVRELVKTKRNLKKSKIQKSNPQQPQNT